MRLLILGGTSFLGRAFAEQALERGDEVTTFNRGLAGPDVPGVTVVRGDRETDLDRLTGHWDAVIDTSAQEPRVAGLAARTLSADSYLFVSSVHAFQDWPDKPVDENSPLHECPPDAEPGFEPYNARKAGCERAVVEGFDGPVLILNAGLIIGPHENVRRVTWWLQRIARGGRVLAPADPARELQVIDARDIAAFGLAHLGENDRYLLTGIPGNTTFGELLAECARVTGSDAEPVWADDDALRAQAVGIWNELPMWAPKMPGVWLASSRKALDAGLRCRPVAESVRDTWEWLRAVGPVDTGNQGISAEKEESVLAAL